MTDRGLTYAHVGATRPEEEFWTEQLSGFRWERTVTIGRGERCWAAASTGLLHWGVKTRSGFTVESVPAAPSASRPAPTTR